MGNKVKDSVIRIVKLLVYYAIYQFVFTYLAMIICGVYYLSVNGMPPEGVEGIHKVIAGANSPVFAWAVSLGLLCSSSMCLWHLMHFGYFKLGKEPFKQVKGNVMLLSVVFIFCSMAVFNYMAQAVDLPDNLEVQMAQMAKNICGVLAIAVVGPILEEVLFRGAIQGFLMRKFNNPWVGIVIASAIFGLVHMNPIQVFYAFFLGLVFGWLYYRTGSLMPCIVGHVLNNSLAAFTMYFGIEEVEIAGEMSAVSEAISIAMLAAVAVCMVYLVNAKQPAVPQPWRGVGDDEEAPAEQQEQQ